MSGNSERLYNYKVDISNNEEVRELADWIIHVHGKVDGLINNAGIIQPFTNLNELEMDKINRVMNINFYGTLYMIKAFLPYLLERSEAHIVNVSSMGGFCRFQDRAYMGHQKQQ